MRRANSTTQHDKHGPATFSLVIPWCCEWVSFILKEVDFKGHLREIFLYDKCSHSVSFFYCRSWRWIHLCLFNSSLSFFVWQGLNAKDAFHVKQDLDMKLSDKDCKKPTRSSITHNIGKNKQSDVDKIKIHFVDLNEPGRSSCMSTDECGAYVTARQ